MIATDAIVGSIAFFIECAIASKILLMMEVGIRANVSDAIVNGKCGNIKRVLKGAVMSPNKSLEAQIDAMIEREIDRESRYEFENPAIPVQEELWDET